MSGDQIKSLSILEDKDEKNVQLHRVESMVNEKVETMDQLTTSKSLEEKPTVYEYVGAKARSFGSGVTQFSVEVIMFLYMFSYILRSITATSMIMDKTCLVHLGYSKHICENLRDHEAIKSEVEKIANNYHLGHSLFLVLPSAILALFIGSWSDKYGRRFPIICALVGIILDGSGVTLCAYFFYSRVEYYYLSAIFTGFSGGFISVLMVLYSYASDVTHSGNRTLKYAFMEVAFGLSMPLGQLAGGWIFKFSGYVSVFLTSTCGHILGLIWVFFFLEETRGLDNTDTCRQKFVNFWSCDSVVSSFRATTKKRPNKGRTQLWVLILGMSFSVFALASLTGILFIYVHHRFNWDNTIFSTVSAVYQVIGLVVMMIIVPLSKKWNIGDVALGIIGSTSFMLRSIATGLAFKPWIFHLAFLLGLLSSLGTLAGRSRISKLVSKDDLGKVFAFLTTVELLFPIALAAISSQIFNLTLDIFPGLIFLIMALFGIIPLVGFIWISRLPVVNYEEMDDTLPNEDVQDKNKEESPVKC